MKFQDIPGHDDVKERLREMADSGRVPHALMLCGTEGTGKMLLARAFAQYVHCTARSGGDSCGRCPSCLQHQSFNNVDLHFSFPVLKNGRSEAISDDYLPAWREFLEESPYMDTELWLNKLGNDNGRPVIYVDESNDILSRMKYTSRQGRQIVIMWLPERMQPACANKMLKLIEEPLGDSLFIFVSNNPGEILPTIYSRTQRIDVKRLPDNIVTQQLVSTMGLSAQDATSAAHLAEGSMLAAIKLASQTGQRAAWSELFKQLMRLAYQRKVAELRTWSNEVAGMGREKSCAFLEYALEQVRENFIIKLGVPSLNYLTEDEEQFARRFNPFINERNVEQLVKEIDDAITDIRANANAKIVLFEFAVKIIMLLRR